MPYKDKDQRKINNKKYYLANRLRCLELAKKYRKQNIDEIRLKGKIYHEKHKDERNLKRRICWSKYYQINKDVESKRKRLYYKTHKDDMSLRGKEYRIKNKIKIKERHKIWYQLNKLEINKRRIEVRKTNISKKFRYNLSALIREKLKRRLLSKDGKSTFSFLPYNIDNLIQHLENHFKPGMSWKNYGKGEECWNIDHIIADCKFNYKSVVDEEFQRCWALENLQPLWAIENWTKNRF